MRSKEAITNNIQYRSDDACNGLLVKIWREGFADNKQVIPGWNCC
ncbi:MAG: hypothetical protein ACMUEK_00595 [Sodalis sp. (in: enterobacteria)]